MKTKENKEIVCACGRKFKDGRGVAKHRLGCKAAQDRLEPKVNHYQEINFAPWQDIPSFSPSTETIEIVQRFEKAVRDHEFMGSKEPEEYNEIQDEYDLAKAALYLHIIKLDEGV
jgi:hypothetical protein